VVDLPCGGILEVVGGVLVPGSRTPKLVTRQLLETMKRGAVLKTSTLALTNATLPYAVEIANKGWKKAIKDNPEIKTGANVVKGEAMCKGVADAFGLECMPIDSLL
jgi:alanine dehydrogenase